jgi:glucose-6-phosphate isomerase
METNISIELATTKNNLLNVLSSFKKEQFNVAPFKGSWTARQVTEHVYKSVKGGPFLLNNEGLPTQRDPEQNVQHLRAMFLDFSTKMKSPDFILPSDEPKDKDNLTALLDDSFTGIIAAAKKQDLSQTVKDFEFPGSGPVTRIELLNFISVHTQRHIHQLQNIYAVM